MLTRLLGRVKLAKLVHSWKAELRMLVTLSGSVILVRLLQRRKAFNPILVTGLPSMVSGMISSPVAAVSQPVMLTSPPQIL